uniref:Uncharacterized protein n=1 Tax=Rhizophagus irregularis (strain DAOM 181602 / DAOM 197198 / MUCL 43194) TaxID=747089 RepID=U9SV38_RHIID
MFTLCLVCKTSMADRMAPSSARVNEGHSVIELLHSSITSSLSFSITQPVPICFVKVFEFALNRVVNEPLVYMLIMSVELNSDLKRCNIDVCYITASLFNNVF